MYKLEFKTGSWQFFPQISEPQVPSKESWVQILWGKLILPFRVIDPVLASSTTLRVDSNKYWIGKRDSRERVRKHKIPSIAKSTIVVIGAHAGANLKQGKVHGSNQVRNCQCVLIHLPLQSSHDKRIFKALPDAQEDGIKFSTAFEHFEQVALGHLFLFLFLFYN